MLNAVESNRSNQNHGFAGTQKRSRYKKVKRNLSSFDVYKSRVSAVIKFKDIGKYIQGFTDFPHFSLKRHGN